MRGAQTAHKVSIGQWVPAAGVITALLVASGVLRLVAQSLSQQSIELVELHLCGIAVG